MGQTQLAQAGTMLQPSDLLNFVNWAELSGKKGTQHKIGAVSNKMSPILWCGEAGQERIRPEGF